MVEKGLSDEVAHRVGEYVQHSGTIHSMLQMLGSNSAIIANENVKAGLDDITLLASYLEPLGIKDDKVLLDFRLARGLDYYTGLIFEVVCRSGAPVSDRRRTPSSDSSPIGSIAAGGRYDNLVGMYSRRAAPFPCVGVSFGVERIFTILKARDEGSRRTGHVDVYVMAFGDGLLLERLAITSQLWDAGIKAEFTAKVKPKLSQQFRNAEGVPLAVILGQDELAVRLKILGLSDNHPEKEGVLVAKADIVAEVQKRLQELSV
jgi:histidyl-tRNA synthetase